MSDHLPSPALLAFLAAQSELFSASIALGRETSRERPRPAHLANLKIRVLGAAYQVAEAVKQLDPDIRNTLPGI